MYKHKKILLERDGSNANTTIIFLLIDYSPPLHLLKTNYFWILINNTILFPGIKGFLICNSKHVIPK
jgi:hypothetical protein